MQINENSDNGFFLMNHCIFIQALNCWFCQFDGVYMVVFVFFSSDLFSNNVINKCCKKVSCIWCGQNYSLACLFLLLVSHAYSAFIPTLEFNFTKLVSLFVYVWVRLAVVKFPYANLNFLLVLFSLILQNAQKLHNFLLPLSSIICTTCIFCVNLFLFAIMTLPNWNWNI